MTTPEPRTDDRVIAYVDGFNLYFGMRSQRLQHLYWLDISAVVRRLLERREVLVATKYFTSRVSGPADKVRRQNQYLDALQALPAFQMVFGVFQTHDRRCGTCGSVHQEHNEKQTDVNIAVALLSDAHRDLFDTALLLTADADLVPAVVAVRQLFPQKRIIAMFPPGRGSIRLGQEVHSKRRIRQWVLEACQLPDEVAGLDEFPRRRPAEWSLPPDDPRTQRESRETPT